MYGYMASDIWLRTILIERMETRCHHIGYSYRLTARVLLYAPSHRQDSTYHGLCYTSRGALAGTRNSSMGRSCQVHYEIHLFIYLHIYLFSYLLIYLFTYLFIYIFIYIFSYLFTMLHIYLFIYTFTYLVIYLFTYLFIYIFIYIFSYLFTMLHIYLFQCDHTNN